jgi:bifunctional non-homologous end joining protein LigD
MPLSRPRIRPFSGRIEPCLPRLAKEPPAGPDWIHEIKHDGFRITARRDGSRVRLISRNGHDLTYRFPLVAAAMAQLPVNSCLIDGEAIVCDDNGLAVFQLIRNLRRGNAAMLCAFDLIKVDGKDLRQEPIEDRKLALRKLLGKSHPGIAYNRHFDVEGAIVFKNACKLGCEGIVSKRLGSPYRSGRSTDWLKVKNPAAPAVKREAEEDWAR